MANYFRNAQARIAAGILDETVEVIFGRGGPMCDMKSRKIYLPEVPDELADRDRRIVSGYLDHEIAHLLFSDVGVVESIDPKSPVKTLFNAIEDGRINKRIGARYPGSRKNIESATYAALQTLRDRREDFDKRGVSGSITRATAALIRIAGGVPVTDALVELSASHDGMARTLLDGASHLFDEMRNADTSLDVKGLAEQVKDVWDEILRSDEDDSMGGDSEDSERQDEQEDNQPDEEQGQGDDSEDETSEQDDQDGQGGGQGESADSDEEGSDDSGAGAGSEGGEDEEGEGSEGAGTGEDGEQGEEEGDSSEGQVGSDSAGEEADSSDESGGDSNKEQGEDKFRARRGGDSPTEEHREAFSDAENAMLGADSTPLKEILERKPNTDACSYGESPDFSGYTTPRFLDSEKDLTRSSAADTDYDLGRIKDMVGNGASVLARRLKMDLLGQGKRNVRGQDHGMVDDSRLASAAVGDQNVFIRRRRRRKINAAISMVVDLSSSMAYTEDGVVPVDAVSALALMFTKTCDQLKIPCEVIGYKSDYQGTNSLDAGDYSRLRRSRFRYIRDEPAQYVVAKSFATKFPQARRGIAAMTRESGGSTPTASGMLYAGERLLDRKEDYKCMIVLTDGEPNEAKPGNGLDCLNRSAYYTRYVTAELAKAGVETVGIGVNMPKVLSLFDQSVNVTSVANLPTEGYSTISPVFRKAASR